MLSMRRRMCPAEYIGGEYLRHYFEIITEEKAWNPDCKAVLLDNIRKNDFREKGISVGEQSFDSDL